MTAAARDHVRDDGAAHGPRGLPDESPGKLGDPEIWVDEAAMDSYGRGDAAPAVTVTPEPARAHLEVPWVGAVIRFAAAGNNLGAPAAYQVISRRWSRDNGGCPYYVCVWLQ